MLCNTTALSTFFLLLFHSVVDNNSEGVNKMEVPVEECSDPSPPVSSSQGKSPLPPPVLEDEPMETNEAEDEQEAEEFDDTSEDGGTKNTSTRATKTKTHSRNLTYPSIIRTRRSSGIVKKQTMPAPTSSKEDSSTNNTPTPQQPTIEDTSGEENSSVDGKDKRSGSRGRGRGGGGPSGKRHKSLEKEIIDELSSSNNKTGTGRGKSTLMTRAAAAGMKGGIQFHQLPRRPKRQKAKEDDDCEEEEEPELPASKKNKVDLDKEEDAEEKEQVSPNSTTGKGGVKSSPKVKGGRGRGKRVKGVKTAEEEDMGSNKKQIKEEIIEEQEDVIEHGKSMGKKRRGRPKKKGKEAATPTTAPVDTLSSEHKEDTSVSGEDLDTSQEMAELTKGSNQISKLLESSENLSCENNNDGEGQDTPTDITDTDEAKSSQDDKEQKGTKSVACEQPKKNDDRKELLDEDKVTTPTETNKVKVATPTETNEVKGTTPTEIDEATPNAPSTKEPVAASDQKSDKGNQDDTVGLSTGSENKEKKAITTSSATDSSQLPTSTIPVDPTYSFPPPHRYSPMDEQGFHHFPMGPSFIAGFPPFTNPPYPPFMLPTSPHFPQPPFPGDCVPPEMFHRFPEDFSRFPVPPPIPGGTSSNTTSTTSQVIN